MAELPVTTSSGEVHRPRNVDWKRAAALLYGDWGTSKAYVIGLAFIAAGFSSFPIILAVCLLTALVAYNYILICSFFPDGGGVYSAAREQSRFLASTGALLLVANFIVTAALSGWAAVSYFGVPPDYVRLATIALVLLVGIINFFGARHSGSLSIWLALPAAAVVVLIVLLSVPHLTLTNLEPRHPDWGRMWVAFVGVILALSGVEAVANLTGVMKLDPGTTPERPKVAKTATKSIVPVAIEVVFGTALLGWAMLSVPKELSGTLAAHKEDMLRYLGEYYATLAAGPLVGTAMAIVVGVIFGFLLFSAVNTAVVALIGVIYMMAQDGEMPKRLVRLNRHGVPFIPLLVAVLVSILVVIVTSDFEGLAGLYAIGVVGAITVNLGACTFNKKLTLNWFQRALMGTTFAVLFVVELTIAKTKPDALFFAICVLGVGLGFRAYSHKLSGLKTVTVTKGVAEMVVPNLPATMQSNIAEGQKILVSARGITPVLAYALDEAALRHATLCVLYVKEIAVHFAVGPAVATRRKWNEDPEANAIMSYMLKAGEERGINIVPLYAVSEDAAATILDMAATLGADFLLIGASQRSTLTHLLRGSVVTNVAQNLPENIRLVIYG